MLDRTDDTLAALAQRIEAEHNAVATALQAALGHAIAAGELLIEAKAKVRHGQWHKWLAKNCDIPQRTCSHYMYLARRRERLCDQNGNALPIRTVNEALHLLKNSYPRPGDRSGSDEPYSEWGERGHCAWGCAAWGSFNGALQTAMRITEFGAPRPSLISRAYRAGKTPGLEPARLREAAALLIRYADAIEAGLTTQR
jgi:hypothetical protein